MSDFMMSPRKARVAFFNEKLRQLWDGEVHPSMGVVGKLRLLRGDDEEPLLREEMLALALLSSLYSPPDHIMDEGKSGKVLYWEDEDTYMITLDSCGVAVSVDEDAFIFDLTSLSRDYTTALGLWSEFCSQRDTFNVWVEKVISLEEWDVEGWGEVK